MVRLRGFARLCRSGEVFASTTRCRCREGEGEHMRFIPTAVHGVLDYVAGVVLMAAPWLFGFNAGGAETWIPVCLGAGMILMSIFTDYEAGLARVIPMKTHLALDAIFGIFL